MTDQSCRRLESGLARLIGHVPQGGDTLSMIGSHLEWDPTGTLIHQPQKCTRDASCRGMVVEMLASDILLAHKPFNLEHLHPLLLPAKFKD